MRNRTIARELALQALYLLDLRSDYMTGDIEAFCKENTDKQDIYQFAMSLIRGCRSHIEEIDEKISRVAEHWDMHRMAIIDKNILRLGVYELQYREDIPPKVSINEAIDLAKKFSTKNSGTFVNGILDKIYTQFGAGQPLETAGAERSSPFLKSITAMRIYTSIPTFPTERCRRRRLLMRPSGWALQPFPLRTTTPLTALSPLPAMDKVKTSTLLPA